MAKPRKTAQSASEPAAAATSPETRHRMIAEAAYYRALKRGFNGGDPVADWLAAEREVGQVLPSGQQQKAELMAYLRLREDVRKLLADARAVSVKTLQSAVDKASAELRTAGGYTADTITRVTENVRKDLANSADRLGTKWETLSEQTADLFAVWRDRGSAFLARAAKSTAEWLEETGGKLEHHAYRSGEMSYAGTLECTGCNERVVLETPAHVPLCPHCGKSEFRRR